MILNKIVEPDGRIRYSFRCPGCKDIHGVIIGPGGWEFPNNNEESPTFLPSIKVTYGPFPEGTKRAGQILICHSFVENGKIRFLDDCWHELKNQIVDMIEYKLDDIRFLWDEENTG